MDLINFYLKINGIFIVFFFKKRVLYFKRPKWKKIKLKIFYNLRQYKKYQKKIVTLKFCKFLKYLTFLKKNIFFKKKIKKKYILFFTKLNSFLKARYFKKIKRNLKFKLEFPYKNNNLLYNNNFFFKKIFKTFFFSFDSINISHFLVRARYIFKNLLLMKSTVLHYFNGCFSIKFFKKIASTKVYKNDLANIFIKPEYRLDILLWRLKFFKSPYLARFAFQKNLILINPNTTYKTFFLKTHFKRSLNGIQLISLSSQVLFFFKQNMQQFTKSLYLPTFLEIDYYSGNIILLKTLQNLTFKDINSVIKEPLCMYKFKNYILK